MKKKYIIPLVVVQSMEPVSPLLGGSLKTDKMEFTLDTGSSTNENFVRENTWSLTD